MIEKSKDRPKSRDGIPKYLSVLGVKYRIDISKDTLRDSDLAADEEVEFCGLTDNDAKVISLAAYQDSSKRWKTLLHEYIHAALFVGGTGHLLEDNSEEAIVRNVESAMVQLIEQVGPQLVKHIRDEHEESV